MAVQAIEPALSLGRNPEVFSEAASHKSEWRYAQELLTLPPLRAKSVYVRVSAKDKE